MAIIERRVGKDGSTTYRARVRKGGYEESGSFQRRRDAETWARQLEADIESGKALPAVESKRHTLAEAIDRIRAGEAARTQVREGRKAPAGVVEGAAREAKAIRPERTDYQQGKV